MNRTVKDLHKKRIKMWDASIGNHKKYTNLDTGVFSTKYTENRNCPVCDTNLELELFYKEGGRYVKCTDCEIVYLNPVFKDTTLMEYYSNNHTIQSEVVESDNDDFYNDLYNKGLENIITINKNITRLLDIGCSSGAFLDLARNRKIQTCGIELNKSEYQIASKKGHIIYNKPLESIIFNNKFDAVTMWDVFEHIKDGESILNNIKNIINKNGLIYLQIPSSDSLAAKILQDKCNMFDGLEHVNLYGVKSIKKLASKCGLQILNIQTVISEIGVINNYLDYENPYLGNTENNKNIVNCIDEDSINKNLLGYKLQIVLGLIQ